MTEDRKMMHAWGPDGYKKIFVDEFPRLKKMGYRDHRFEMPVVEAEPAEHIETSITPELPASTKPEGKDKPKRAYRRKK